MHSNHDSARAYRHLPLPRLRDFMTTGRDTVTTQLVRYGVVGLGLNASAYLMYLTLTAVGLSPYAVVSTLYPVFMLLSFFLNRRWSFAYQGSVGRNLGRFLLAHLGGYLLNLLVLFSLTEWLAFPHEFAQAVSILVVAVYLFIVFRHYVYAGDLSASPDSSSERGTP